MPKRTATIDRSGSSKKQDNNPEETIVSEESDDNSSKSLNLSNLKDLIFLGRLQKEVEIGGYNFFLTTLTTKEQKTVMQKIMIVDDVTRLLDAKPVTLAFALKTVNDVNLEDICEDEDLEDSFDKRISVIMSLQVGLIESLFKAYEELIEESSKTFEVDDLKA
tara:strand:+ start:1827 stop:2315 length:489 start_codon:yes stop_codon:yes gene_type:complete